MVERFPSQTLLDVRFSADNGVVVGTEADLVQGLLDEMMGAFAQMGVRVDHGKTKWMLVARSKWVNCIQHGVYCNLVQGGPETYFNRGLQQIECLVCYLSNQHWSLQWHINHQHPNQVGRTKIDFFSLTPNRVSRWRTWAVGPLWVVCPVPLCLYKASTVLNLYYWHMAARHPQDDLYIVGYPGYHTYAHAVSNMWRGQNLHGNICVQLCADGEWKSGWQE